MISDQTEMTIPRQRSIFDVGKLILILGSMCSGKTTRGLNIVRLYSEFLKCNCLYIESEKSKRLTKSGDEVVTTHNPHYNPDDKIKRIRTDLLSNVELRDDFNSMDVIMIDEQQNYPDLNFTVRKWVLELDKLIVMPALSGDFKLELIGDAHLLIPIASEIIHCTDAICSLCLQESKNIDPSKIIAYFTIRLGNQTEQKIAGGTDMYMPVCMRHRVMLLHSQKDQMLN